MARTCLIRQDPPGEKFFMGASIISVAQNRLNALSEEHEEEASSASESFSELAPRSEPFEAQPLPSDMSTVPIALGRSVSKFDPSTVQQPLFDNDEPIDDSSQRSAFEANLNKFASSSDVQIQTSDPSLIQPTAECFLDSSIVSLSKIEDPSGRNDQERSSEKMAWVKPIDDQNVANGHDVLVNDASLPTDQEFSKADPLFSPTSYLMLDSSLSEANNEIADQFSSDTNDEDTATSAVDFPSSPRIPVDPSLIYYPETLLDASVVSQSKEDELLENSSGSSETNSEEIAWVAPVDHRSSDIGPGPDTKFEVMDYVVPFDDHIIGNDEDSNLNEIPASSDLPVLISDVSQIQPPRALLDPSVISHRAIDEPSVVNASDFPLNISDEDSPTLDPSLIHSPRTMFDPSVLSQPDGDPQVFHQVNTNDNDNVLSGRDFVFGSHDNESSSSPSNNYDDSSNFPRSSDNSAMKSSGRSNVSDFSGSVRCSGSFRASDYFERTIIEEYNLRIEEEQRDCFLVSMPVVAAVYDDTTTILVRPPSTAVANLENNGNTGANARQTSRQLDRQQPPAPSPRKTTLSIPQLKKLRQEFGLPTGVVLEIGEFQRIACTFFVCDTNEVEEDCIKECAQLAAACQTQAIFCYGTYQREILYPPAKLANGKVPRSGPVLIHCGEAVRNSGRFTTTKETTMKLMEIAKRIPLFDRWPSEKVAVTIFTDRTFYSEQEDDKEFVSVIRSLVKLGARVVIRLSTSQRDVVSYYLYLKQTFSSLTIIYSYDFQKRLVHHFNPWLNYGAPLHRARELGFYFHRTVEFLGKRILNKDHLREFLVVFHGKKAMIRAPDIHSEWSDFYAFLTKINQKEGKHRLAVDSRNKNRRDYWIDLKHFERLFRNENEELQRRSRSNEQRGSFSQFLRVEI
jgi:hypothetical protein